MKVFNEHINHSIAKITGLKDYSKEQKQEVIAKLAQLKQETQQQVIAAGTNSCEGKINEAVKEYKNIITRAARQEPEHENFFYKLIHKILNKFPKSKVAEKDNKKQKAVKQGKSAAVKLSNNRYSFLVGDQKKLNQLQEKLPAGLRATH